MPIKDKSLYPKDWREISQRIRQQARWQCQKCGAVHGDPHPLTGSNVVLTVAHLDHNPANCSDLNLMALCQRCHLRYDARLHAQHARETRQAKKLAAAKAAGQTTFIGE